jgi:tetratricopeptide (TPR) repeat protein
VRDALKAEQAYREALAIDPTHEGALIGYGALLLSRQRFVEAEVFLQSAVDRHPSALSWGFVSLFFDELHRSLPDSPEEDARRTHCKREAKAALVQAMRLVGVDDLSNPNAASDAVHVLLARRLVALHHEEQANTSLSRVATPSIDVELLYARIFLQTRQYDEALRQCEKVRADAAALAGPARAAVTAAAHTLQADVHAALDQPVEAERNYDAAMRMHPDGATGRTYVHYGNACARLGKYGDALTAFLSAAKLWPCGLAWLGVGIAYYRTGDMVRAEQALNESNILNNLCAKTWAFLALVCLRHRRDADADQAFNQAAKLGLSDAALIAEVGSELQRAGRHGVAEPCLRRALAVRDDSNTRMLLARSLLSLKRLGDARTEFLHVARTTQNDTQRRSAEEQAAAIAALGLADS